MSGLIERCVPPRAATLRNDVLRKILGRSSVRFLIAGGANTLASYLLYLALLEVFSYRVSYSVSYVAGMVLSFLLNSRFVFLVPLRWQSFLRYPLLYVGQYILGLALLSIGVEVLGVSEVIMPFLVLAVTLPVSFVLTRLLLRGTDRRGVEIEG